MNTAPPAARFPRWLVLVGLLLLVGGGAATVWFVFLRNDADTTPSVRGPDPDLSPPADPRLTFATEFKNVHPDVKYLGDAACTACHKDISHSYHQHPMGRSAAVVGHAGPLEKYDPAAQNPFVAQARELSVQADGKRHTVKGVGEAAELPAYEVPVEFAIGSGTRGRSYLTVDRGAVWQSPVSWFTADARWNVSPGFDLGEGGRRAVRGECLACHVNQTRPEPRSENLYKEAVVGQAAIGCERCHGPGELHARKHADGGQPTGRDATIVNPKHLSPSLQTDICRQCHLMGEQRVTRRGREVSEYRPGLPLEQFVSVFVRHPDLSDGLHSVGQFEQMEMSGCHADGKTGMTCTSCHDPHAAPAPANKAAFYRAKCQTCHEKKGCSQPEAARKAKDNSCVACHMPKRDSASIAHAAVTDHRILRRAFAPPVERPNTGIASGRAVLPYPAGPHPPTPDEKDRDLGVALAIQAGGVGAADPGLARTLAKAAVEKLTAAVEHWPADDIAWLRLASAHALLGDTERWAAAARKAAELQPKSEWALAARAEAEEAAGDTATAAKLWGELCDLNPSATSHRVRRAKVLLARQDWAGAEAACGEAIGINPLLAEARLYRAVALNRMGKADDAKKEGDAAVALQPNPAVQEQYRQLLRPPK